MVLRIPRDIRKGYRHQWWVSLTNEIFEGRVDLPWLNRSNLSPLRFFLVLSVPRIGDVNFYTRLRAGERKRHWRAEIFAKGTRKWEQSCAELLAKLVVSSPFIALLGTVCSAVILFYCYLLRRSFAIGRVNSNETRRLFTRAFVAPPYKPCNLLHGLPFQFARRNNQSPWCYRPRAEIQVIQWWLLAARSLCRRRVSQNCNRLSATNWNICVCVCVCTRWKYTERERDNEALLASRRQNRELAWTFDRERQNSREKP